MMASEAGQNTAMAKARLQTALQSLQSSGRAFQLIHQHAPAHVSGTASATRKCRTLVVLDSSFNPPTLAHMQMATSALRDLRTRQSIAAAPRGGSAGQRHGLADDVRLLLLLAVNNADKAPKPATFEERLLMMEAFARDIQRTWRTLDKQTAAQDQEEQAHVDEATLPVDIGLTTHPYFHDKSAAIAASPEYDGPSSRTSDEGEPHTKQIFLAGYDTLIRIFTPRYYAPPVAEVGVDPPQPDKTPMQTALDPFFGRAQLRVTMRTDDDWGGRDDQLGYIERIMHGKELEEVGGRREWAARVELVEGTSVGPEGGVVSSTLARAAVKAREWDRLRELVPSDVARLIEEDAVAW